MAHQIIASSNCTIRHSQPISNIFLVPPTEFGLNDHGNIIPTTSTNLPVLPVLGVQNTTPIVLQFTDLSTDNDDDKDHNHTEFQSFVPCDIPCWYAGTPENVVADRYVTHLPDGRTWDIVFSMEGPQYYSQLYVNKNSTNHWQNDQFYSTTSYHSDIPLPYYSSTEFHI